MGCLTQPAFLTVPVEGIREMRREMRMRFDVLSEDVAAVRAAVVPREPAPGA